MLKLLLAESTRLDWAAETLDLEWLQHPILRQIVERRLSPTGGSATEATAFLNDHWQTVGIVMALIVGGAIAYVAIRPSGESTVDDPVADEAATDAPVREPQA